MTVEVAKSVLYTYTTEPPGFPTMAYLSRTPAYIDLDLDLSPPQVDTADGLMRVQKHSSKHRALHRIVPGRKPISGHQG
ncbi:hypothetical protein RRG08_053743 [Elysia crispata]|uniref:Uncharacterized protein n=1 Tax=Elysia crispata TaxID=231223 RepID=A0AAE1E7R1_9GAST|nr:hypothetical protein RRG08_053743 [Elysia crispata]